MTVLIPSYLTLRNVVRDYLKDSEVTDALIDTWTGVAEFEIQEDLLSEEYGGGVPRQMMARVTGQTDANSSYDLPADYLGVHSVMVGGRIARFASPEKVPSDASGLAQADVVLDYYQALEQLSDSNVFNWLIQDGFNVYLWGVCRQYPLWGHHPQDIALWQPKYQQAVRALKRAHAPQPKTAFNSLKGRPYGVYYTVIGTKMRFAYG